MAQRELTIKQEAFAVAISNGIPKNAAYRQIYDCSSMKDASVITSASKLLRNNRVASRIAALRDRAADAAGFGAADVIKQLWGVVNANSDELTSYQRVNCRHCHGVEHNHQWIDGEEFAHAVAVVMSANASAKPNQKQKPLPNDEGGYGYRLAGHTNEHCPKCQGEGTERLYIADTRKLSPNARMLYAGVRKTKEGIEIKQHDKMTALLALAKHFKVIGDGGTSVTVNANSSASATAVPEAALPVSAQDAAKIYQKIMKGR